MLGLCVCTREFMTQLKEKGKDEGHIFLINRYAKRGENLLQISSQYLQTDFSKYAKKSANLH